MNVIKFRTNPKIFIDTNLLIYCVDNKDIRKQTAAREIISNLLSNENGVISTQSLQEFFNASTKKIHHSKEVAKNFISYWAKVFPVHSNTTADIENAIDISIQNKLSFWDSLVISAALAEGCTTLYSEDLNNGQIIHGLEIVNPFCT